MKTHELLEGARKSHVLKGGFVVTPRFDSITDIPSPSKLVFDITRIMDDGHGELWIARSFGHYRWIVYFNGAEGDLPSQQSVRTGKETALDTPALLKWAETTLNDESLWVESAPRSD